MRRLLAAVCLTVTIAAQAAPAEQTWMSVLLGGRKVGSMQTTREVRGDRVVTSQHMRIELERAGTRTLMTTSEVDEETRDGRPLAFESRTRLSGKENSIRGEVDSDGRVEVHSRVGGAASVRTITWPEGALLAEGLRLAEARAGTAPGTRFSNLAFQPDLLAAITIDSRIGETEPVDLPGGKRVLTRVGQTVHLPGATTRATSWIDAGQNVAKLVMPVLGYELTMVACSRACAQAPNQPADILVHSLVPAPRPLSADERRKGVRLRLSAVDGGEAFSVAATGEQKAVRRGKEIIVDIRPGGVPNAGEAPPDAADRLPNDWLQSDAPKIVELARRGAGTAQSPAAKMQNLEDFVRGYISNKDLSVGYASALEVANKPEGDCTEHAVLLAALGRALGIPTRVVDGIVYVDDYAGGRHVFVPHAWTQAWVGGHWRSFDAALHGFDAGHLALSVGDGDPWRFFAGFDALGRMRVDAIDALP